MISKIKETILSILGLFISLNTIFCCTLPIILVLMGFGTSFASLTNNLPFIHNIAEKAVYLFAISAILLAINGYLIFIRKQICPANKELGKKCAISKKINKIIWYITAIILAISFFFKYILILLL